MSNFILIAEDHDDARRALASALRDDGHRVLPVARGDELLHTLVVLRDRGSEPDLVISELDMPGLSGLEALELARAGLPALPTLLLTTDDDPSLPARAARLEVGCIFRKPFDPGVLRAAVIAMLGGRRRRD